MPVPDALLPVIATAVLVVGAGLITALVWWRRHSARALLRGFGAMLIPIGLWIAGVMNLVVEWARSLYHWILTTVATTTIWIGVGLFGLGVLLWVIGSFIAPVSRQEAKQRRTQQTTKRVSGSAPKQVGQAKPAAPAAAKPAADDSSDEDAEIEAILRARGID